MVLDLRWVFLVTILKGDLCKTRDTECLRKNKRGAVRLSYHDSLFALVLREVKLMESYRGLLHPGGP
jgi:hypothetical protein